MSKPRTDYARMARERLLLIQQQEQEITELRRGLAKAKAGDAGEDAEAELDAFATIRAELDEAGNDTPADIAKEVERMAGRLALLEEFMGAVEEAYGSTPEDLRYAAAELKRFASIPDECVALAEALAVEVGPEPVTWLAQRFSTVPALRGARTAREVAAVLSLT